MKTAVQSISSSPVHLKINFPNGKTLENVEGHVETIDDNGQIEIEVSEDNDDILWVLTIRAKMNRIRRMKEVASYNVAQYLTWIMSSYIIQVNFYSSPVR